MSWTDLMIIYLAAGAPFAVHDYLSREPGYGSVLRSIANGLIWIILVPSFLHGLVTSKLNRRGRRIAPKDRLVRDLESRLTAGSDSHEVFRVREILGRYAGLSEAVRESHGGKPDAQFFEIAGHPDPGLAGEIFARSVRSELEERRDAAAGELIGILAEPHAGTAGSDESTEALRNLFEGFGDQRSISRLKNVIVGSTEAVFESQHKGGTAWNGSFANQSIIRANSIGLPDLTRTSTPRAGDWKD